MYRKLQSLNFVISGDEFNLASYYNSIFFIRRQHSIKWDLNDLIQVKNLYKFFNNLINNVNEENIALINKILIELSFLETKISAITSKKNYLKYSRKEIEKFFSKSYKNIPGHSLIKILTLQLIYNPNSIRQNTIDNLLHTLQSNKNYFFKNFPNDIVELLNQIENNIERVDNFEIKNLLNSILKILDILKLRTTELVNSNCSVIDFEIFFKNIRYLVCYNFDTIKLLEKVMELLDSSSLDKEKKQIWKNELIYLKSEILENLSTTDKIKFDIREGNILLTDDIPTFQFNYLAPNSFDDDIILTIDESYSLDLDGAFKIKKEKDLYMLDLYVTDVPSFLMQNDSLFWESYKRGTSMYAHFQDEQIAINMLPTEFSNNLLSLREGTYHHTICFTFIIGENGQIYDTKLNFKDIKVFKNIPPIDALNIIKTPGNLTPYSKTLKLYNEVCKLIINTTENKFLRNLGGNILNYLVALPSILINSYVANYDCFSIYLKGGKYTKLIPETPYAHSCAPLRRFNDDINLIFFLQQNNIANYDDTKLYFFEENIDEIIEHLNYRNKIAHVVSADPSFVRKYILK